MHKTGWLLLLVSVALFFPGCRRKDYSFYARQALEHLFVIYADAKQYKSDKQSLSPLKTKIVDLMPELQELKEQMDAVLPEEENEQMRVQKKYMYQFSGICNKLEGKASDFERYSKNAGVPALLTKIVNMYDPKIAPQNQNKNR